jgi:phosphomannomutase/phosphomannomutase/phosphoglucomutase
MSLACFKAYDVRGRVPEELDESLARRIGRAFVDVTGAREVVVGRDIRLSSPSLATAVIAGINESGADVLDIGVCGTEEVYFGTAHSGAGGGIMITASHNPPDYNGMKFVGEGARPISGDSGLGEIRDRAAVGIFGPVAGRGAVRETDMTAAYTDHLLGYIEATDLTPLTVVTNPGNGGAGRIVDLLESRLPLRFVKVHHEADGHFPNGVPNPLLPENRGPTSEAVVAHGADFGVAWDGDFDRCFLFDEKGQFIEGYYIVGLLATAILQQNPGARIIHDPRLTWNTIDMVEAAGGVPVQSKTGHAFIKERMRSEDAVYGGEMSAHHYFRDFAYCDSGMIPWLMVADLISRSGKPLSELVSARMKAFPASGEINRRLADPAAAIADVTRRYGESAIRVDRTDGVSLEFPDWRFNLRSSNTEPVVRLNVEARGDQELMGEKTRELLAILDSGA